MLKRLKNEFRKMKNSSPKQANEQEANLLETKIENNLN